MKTQAISRTNALTYKLIEPYELNLSLPSLVLFQQARQGLG